MLPTSGTLLFAGALNVDFSIRVPHLPEPGETVLGPNYQVMPGGKAANQAVACARAGGQAALVGAVGTDPFAEVALCCLRASGVNLSGVRTLQGSSGAAFIGISDTGENTILVAAGTNAALRPEDLPDLTAVDMLVLPLETPLPTIQAFAEAAWQRGVQVVLNAAPAQTLPPLLLQYVSLLIVNEGELRALMPPVPTEDLWQQLRAVQQQGPKAIVVTLGERGCAALLADGTQLRIPAPVVTAVDTTGAGDTFTGTLVAALSRGLHFADALIWASAAAALACTRPGAQPSIPSADEVEAFLSARVTG
ncbi:ribokinase [Deinococcus oregonensis]|uniref:Ribokinase n=1 Tax=Deinococcus oregonensis TaxID=1805970 RepID=A0ABV6AV75_9DEIO